MKNVNESRLMGVTSEDVEKAIEVVSKWVNKKMQGDPEYGPFSERVLSEKASEFFPMLALEKLATGEWQWKPELCLSTQMIRIIRSEMSHRKREWGKKGTPCDIVSLTDVAIAKEVASLTTDEVLGDDEIVDSTYDRMLEVLKGRPRLVAYVSQVRETNDYRSICAKLRITMDELRELEQETLRIIKKAKDDEVFFY